jgi:NAD(P)H-dependent flavin oxidoreductase YrpB (nitropropane dioxygenase family)
MKNIILPKIIQGGMGVYVSRHQLANAIAKLGGIGVVSGTGIAEVITRQLQDGDPEIVSEIKEGFAAFPKQEIAKAVLEKFLDKKFPGGGYYTLPMWGSKNQEWLEKITIISAFTEVWLAKKGLGSEGGMIGINLMHKITAPLPSLMYGAMLAEVDLVFVGAGIPTDIPEAIGNLSRSERAACCQNRVLFNFDPNAHGFKQKLAEPLFGAIVSSNILAKKMARGCDILVLENHTAGGHNAPPREKTEGGEISVWGNRDLIETEMLKDLKIPIFMAGGYGNPEGLKWALDNGFAGIQAGSVFAFCQESGWTDEVKKMAIEEIKSSNAKIISSAIASPTGYPFKILKAKGTMSDAACFSERDKSCRVGLLREVEINLEKEIATPNWSCKASQTGSQTLCLCEALLAAVGLAQVNRKKKELPIITLGEELKDIKKLLRENNWRPYLAEAAYKYIMGENIATP